MQSRTTPDFDDFPPATAVKVALPPKKTPIRLEFPPVDVRLLTEQCLGNLAFGISLLEQFQASAPERLAKLKQQVERQDFPAVAEMAHGLKGVVGVLGAESLLDLTINLQTAAESEDVDYIDELIPRIEHELQRLEVEIPRLRSMV